MSPALDPRASERIIRSVALKVHRRVHALGGRTTQLEDVEQELWGAWCKARDAYDPERGVKFVTFLYATLYREINRWVNVQFERFHDQTVALSFDRAMEGEDGAGDSLHEVVADPLGDTEQRVVRNDAYLKTLGALSPRAQVFVRLLTDTPPDLAAEWRRLDAKADWARQLGLAHWAPNDITPTLVFDFMDAPRGERTTILQEIETVTARLNEEAP